MAHPVVLCFNQVELLLEGSQPTPVRQILKLSPDHRAEEVASLPLRHGGLGLRSAQRIHALAMIQQRHPAIVNTIVGALENNAESVSIRCLLDCVRKLAETGFEVLDWTDLAEGKIPGDEGEDDPCQPKRGWQKRAANSVEERFFSNTVWPSLGDSERALALSQCGPLASVPFALESVAARVCREAGARVRTNTFIRDMLGYARHPRRETPRSAGGRVAAPRRCSARH